MSNTDPIIINGQRYDPATGLPITKKEQDVSEALPTPSRHHPAVHLHTAPQKSTTLRRKSTKRPATPEHHAIIKHQQPAAATTETHAEVRKFAPHPVGAVAPTRIMDIGPVKHPFVNKAHAKSELKAKASQADPLAAAVIKHDAIEKAIQNTSKKPPLKTRLLSRQRTIAVLASVFVIVVVGGYFTYLALPNLSVRVAAIQAGINAVYPNYRPDGYILSGPVTFADGKVSINFKANGGTQDFTINQTKSGWNNEAVLDNYVTPRAGTNYIPYTDHGLTIYTYSNNAAWVNGGILYTLEGNAPLSSEQIRRIATSLL